MHVSGSGGARPAHPGSATSSATNGANLATMSEGAVQQIGTVVATGHEGKGGGGRGEVPGRRIKGDEDVVRMRRKEDMEARKRILEGACGSRMSGGSRIRGDE